MGWWRTPGGSVLGDPPADYLDGLEALGCRWTNVQALPGEVRERLAALYVEGLGRPPSEAELEDLLRFCFGDSD